MILFFSFFILFYFDSNYNKFLLEFPFFFFQKNVNDSELMLFKSRAHGLDFRFPIFFLYVYSFTLIFFMIDLFYVYLLFVVNSMCFFFIIYSINLKANEFL